MSSASTTAIAFPAARPIVAATHRDAPKKRLMSDIESPCNKVCVVDAASKLCIGCGRTLAEIGGWIGFTPEERRRVMAELPARLATLRPSRQNNTDAG
jgi:uncharacterized protein